MFLIFLETNIRVVGRRYDYLDEEDPAQDDSHSPAREPSLPASLSRSPVRPPAAAAAPGPAPPPGAPAPPKTGTCDVVGRRIRAVVRYFSI